MQSSTFTPKQVSSVSPEFYGLLSPYLVMLLVIDPAISGTWLIKIALSFYFIDIIVV